MFVAAKAVSNSAVSAASVADASMLAAVAGTIGASNWSMIAVTFASTGYSVVTVQKTKTFAFAAKHAGEKFAFVAVDVTIASSFDRVVEESGTRSLMVANSWRSVFATMTEGKNLAVEEMAANNR